MSAGVKEQTSGRASDAPSIFASAAVMDACVASGMETTIYSLPPPRPELRQNCQHSRPARQVQTLRIIPLSGSVLACYMRLHRHATAPSKMWPGFSINFLSASERERSAQELLFEAQPAAPGHCFTSACPFHSEKTPGGAFWYDPERNSAHCYSCDTHGNLIDIFCAVNGYDEGSSEGFKAFLGPKVLSHYFTNFSKSRFQEHFSLSDSLLFSIHYTWAESTIIYEHDPYIDPPPE